ncbi:M56 family metallopeptidase [Kitasatospora sp. NPDC098652]|uniref:M56 family metallopeptidase n=1 Tax=Kitasatospora sp. NPDC098652 TaxID=3364095 RepID=UPI00381446DF
MNVDVYAPLLASALLAGLGPALSHRLSPKIAAWALLSGAVVSAVCWAGSLALLASTGIGQIRLVAAIGQWSRRALRAQAPVSPTVSWGCALILATAVSMLLVATCRRTAVLHATRRACRRLRGHRELAVLEDPQPVAYALPGTPGRIVVSTGMLRLLDGGEQQALLAHERAHLRARHHLFLLTLHLAVAVNPLLRPLAREGAFVLERWADEEAGRAVGDRSVVARAVARAALAGGRTPAGALAATEGPVPRRVRALFAPAPKAGLMPLAVGALLVAVSTGSLAAACHDTDRMFDKATRPASAAHP